MQLVVFNDVQTEIIAHPSLKPMCLCVHRQRQPFPDEEHAVLVAVRSGGDRSHAEADHQTHASAHSSGALALSHHRWCSQPPQRRGLLHAQHTHTPQLSRYANTHQPVYSSQIRSGHVKHEWTILPCLMSSPGCSRLTDRCLVYLRRLSCLSVLDLRGCKGVSRQACESFISELSVNALYCLSDDKLIQRIS